MKKILSNSHKRFLGYFLSFIVVIFVMAFFASSCGQGPAQKTLNPERGAHALKFTKRDTNPDYNTKDHYVTAGEGVNLAKSPITVEAWVKIPDSIQSGEIMRRSDPVLLKIDSGNVVAFGTSIPITPVTVNDGNWHHIAGVLVDDITIGDHNHSITSTCTLQAMANMHVDIYIDGKWKNCASRSDYYTASEIDECKDVNDADKDGDKNEDIPCPTLIGYKLYNDDSDGIIDELRLWKVIRTSKQISDCMKTELGIGGGDCSIASPGLSGYWKFNEGLGLTVTDHSGIGNSGTKIIDLVTDNKIRDWVDGWVEGNWK